MAEFGNSTKIWVPGHTGLVGASVVRALQRHGFQNILVRSRKELDLTQQAPTHAFVKEQKPECVIVAAARVGGIMDNKLHQADFLYENLAIATNIIHAAAEHGVKKLVYLGSSCIYPRLAPQPIPESALLSGALEPTNEGYAVAKIAGLKLCEKFREQYGKRFVAVMPTNLYGPHDRYHLEHSHVIPSLLMKFHRAKVQQASEVQLWGSGAAKREFLYVDDLAEALLVVLQKFEGPDHINIGYGDDITIKELALLVREVVGYQGHIAFDIDNF